MDEVHHQNQQQEPILIPNSSIPHKHKQQKLIIIPSSSMFDLDHHHHCHHQILNNNNDLFTMLHLNSSTNHSHKNSTKRPSPPSPSTRQRSAKKHSFDQDDLTRNGFSAVTLPICLYSNVLRRCISDPCQSSEQSTPPPTTTTVKGSGLPPLPPNLRRCMSDVIPSKVKSVSRSENHDTSTPDSLRLKRMKDRLREMKQWWDEVMKEEAEEQQPQEVEEEEQQQQAQEEFEEEKEQSPVAEEENVLSQDKLKEEFEEAVSVEWGEKCLRLTFKCPCDKGYEVLICDNNCYYKLV